MSDNVLKTTFIFDTELGDKKIEITRSNLFALNDDINNIGKKTTFGKTIAADFDLAGKGVDTFKNKVADLSRPTFGGEYYEESKKINTAFESAAKGADNFKAAAETSFSGVKSRVDAGRESLRDIGKYYNETSRELNKPLADGKNFSPLAQASSKLHSELARLQTDISGLNATLLKTTNKSVIKIINEDLAVAETRFNKLNAINDRLAQKANAVAPTGNAAPSASESTKTTGFGRLRGFGAIFRAADLGINESEINAGLAAVELFNKELAITKSATIAATTAKTTLTAATTASTAATAAEGAATAVTTAAVEAETVAFGALSLASLGIFAGVAAAGFAVYEVSKKIREESEHRLKVEESINGEINKQLLAGIELRRQFTEQSANAARSDNFGRSVQGETKEQLERRQQSLTNSIQQSEILKNAAAFTKDFGGVDLQKLENNLANDRREKIDVEKRLRDLPFEQSKFSNDSFNRRNEDFKKSQESVIQSEKAAFERRAASIEKAKEKVKELGKTYADTFVNLNQKLNAENPVALAFAEGKKELDALKESLRGLSPELQNQAVAIQNKLNGNALFNARLDNDFAAFDLKQRASELRDFKTPKIEDQSKFFADFVADGLKQAIAANGGSGTRFNRLGSGGFSQSDIAAEFSTNFNRVSKTDGSFGGFSQSARSFADLTNREKFDFLNKDNVGAQNKLSAAFDLAGNREKLNDDQQSAIDRKILSLSGTFRPDQLNDRQRDIVATAAENEAKRKSEKEDKSFEVQVKIEEHLKKLREIAEKGGENALKIILQDETESGRNRRFFCQPVRRAAQHAETAIINLPASASAKTAVISNLR